MESLNTIKYGYGSLHVAKADTFSFAGTTIDLVDYILRAT